MRSFKRRAAKEKLKELGYVHFLKKMRDGRSYFSHYWRKYC